jgi:hypothetical protein
MRKFFIKPELKRDAKEIKNNQPEFSVDAGKKGL